MNIYCVDLNWDIPLLAPDVDIDFFKKARHTKGSMEQLHPLLLDHLNSKGVSISFIEAFYSEPNYKQGIHSDKGGGDIPKLNWVFGGHGSLMHWFMPRQNISIERKYTPINSSYIDYTRDQVYHVHSREIGKPSLVQAGIPHNIVNGLEERLCLSLSLKEISMEKAIELLVE
jgi:hypothetical protein